MGSFNFLYAPLLCPHCGDRGALKGIQFRFGFVDGRSYHLGDGVEWFPGEEFVAPNGHIGPHTTRPRHGHLQAIGYASCLQCGRLPEMTPETEQARALYDRLRQALVQQGRLQPVRDVEVPDFVDRMHERGDRYFLVDARLRADIYLLQKYQEITGRPYFTIEEVLITVREDRLVTAELTIYEPFYHTYPIVEVG